MTTVLIIGLLCLVVAHFLFAAMVNKDIEEIKSKLDVAISNYYQMLREIEEDDN